MPGLTRAADGGLTIRSTVQGNDTPLAESVNVAKVRPDQHLRPWELQDYTRPYRIPLELSGLLQDNQRACLASSDATLDSENSCKNFARGADPW